MNVQQYFRVPKNLVDVPIDLTPSSAFSFRKINPAYSGNCVKVRRSSDNTLLDIGFSSGVLDESTLLAFVGGGDGFVHTFFNQFGSTNKEQNSNSLQPRLVASGVVEKLNTKPCINFVTADQRMDSTGLITRVQDDTSAYITYVASTSNTATQVILGTAAGTVYGLASAQGSSSTPISQNFRPAPVYPEPERNYFLLVDETVESPTNRGQVYNVLNGSHIVSECNCGASPAIVFMFGTYATGSVGFVGKVNELIIHNRDFDDPILVAEMQSIQNEINTYYSVY